jgi:hypothetical protein
MTELDHSRPVIRLQSANFTIVGTPSTIAEQWYEIEIIHDGVSLGDLGGQVRQVFKEQMLGVLENEHGRKLGSIPRAKWKDLVGGDDSEYLGYAVLSGYDTMYFFRDGPRLLHVVLANAHGVKLAHSQFDAEVFDCWRQQLRDF